MSFLQKFVIYFRFLIIMSDKVSGVGGDDDNNSVEEESHDM